MYNKVRLCDTPGKAIQAAEQYMDADIVITFTDGTYVALRPRHRYDDSQIEEIDVSNTRYYEARHAAVKAGAMTNEEEIEQRNNEERHNEEQAKANRRAQYERLRREFDKPQG